MPRQQEKRAEKQVGEGGKKRHIYLNKIIRKGKEAGEKHHYEIPIRLIASLRAGRWTAVLSIYAHEYIEHEDQKQSITIYDNDITATIIALPCSPSRTRRFVLLLVIDLLPPPTP